MKPPPLHGSLYLNINRPGMEGIPGLRLLNSIKLARQ
jgi:hypothetical protein